MLKFFNSLFGRVVIALVAGIVIGALFPHFAQSLRPLGDGFLKLIKMVIGPIVFCVVVSGMAHAGDLKKVGRVGLKSVVYFEIMTTIALLIGAHIDGVMIVRYRAAGAMPAPDEKIIVTMKETWLREIFPPAGTEASNDSSPIEGLPDAEKQGKASQRVRGARRSSVAPLISQPGKRRDTT